MCETDKEMERLIYSKVRTAAQQRNQDPDPRQVGSRIRVLLVKCGCSVWRNGTAVMEAARGGFMAGVVQLEKPGKLAGLRKEKLGKQVQDITRSIA